MSPPTRIEFQRAGEQLTAVSIVRAGRSPVISSLHRALLALGIVVSGYEARQDSGQLFERIVLERRDGGPVEAPLSEETQAAVLSVAGDAECSAGPSKRPRRA